MVFNTYDPSKWELIYKKKLDLNEKNIYDLDLNPDGEKQLVVTNQGGQSFFIDLENSASRIINLRLSNADYGLYNRLNSIRFNGNGKEILAATANSSQLLLYDILVNREILKLNQAHKERLNYACYKDKNDASNIILSGCDQGIIRMWDKRVMNDNNHY